LQNIILGFIDVADFHNFGEIAILGLDYAGQREDEPNPSFIVVICRFYFA